LTITLYDHNKLSNNEIIGSNNLNLKKYLNKIHKTKTTVEIPREWITLDKVSTLENVDTGGEVEIEMKLMTFQEAESNKAGIGRSEPNKDPVLETPKEGRGFLDQFSMLGDLLDGVGSFYAKIFQLIKVLAAVFVVAIIVYLISQFAKI
jgi:hypothetical protein